MTRKESLPSSTAACLFSLRDAALPLLFLAVMSQLLPAGQPRPPDQDITQKTHSRHCGDGEEVTNARSLPWVCVCVLARTDRLGAARTMPSQTATLPGARTPTQTYWLRVRAHTLPFLEEPQDWKIFLLISSERL